MIGRWLGVEGGIHYPSLGLRVGAPGWVVFGLVAVAFVAAMWMYRRETSLAPRQRRTLGLLRGSLLALLALLFFGPVFRFETDAVVQRNIGVVLDLTDSMNLVDPRDAPSDIAQAAVALGDIPYPPDDINDATRRAWLQRHVSALSADRRKAAAGARRIDLALAALSDPRLQLLGRLGDVGRLHYFSLGEQVTSVRADGGGRPPASWLDAARPDAVLGASTALGAAQDEVAAALAGGVDSAVILITDGASNRGRDPLEAARSLSERDVSVFTVGVGMPAPPDARIVTATLPEAAFLDDRVAALAHVDSTGLDGEQAVLAVYLDDVEEARRDITLRGGSQFEEIAFKATRGGDRKIELRILPVPGEVTVENNVYSRPFKIIEDKIRVLYMEGMPRWEFRYLRQILLRDHRLDVKFCMTEGDPMLPVVDPERYLSAFPSRADEADRFDLLILGDVAPNKFTPDQLERIRELVVDRGGSLLMIAGRRHAPTSYRGTVIEQLLPVRLGQGAWVAAPRTAYPVLTAEGKRDVLARLEFPDVENERLWSLLRPMDLLPPLEGAKPGATVLMRLSEPGSFPEDYPLMAWHRVGAERALGSVLFLSMDQLWRLRYKRGDHYHARFWRQTVKFLTLSRFLSDTARVTIDIPARASYRTGERIPVYVHALSPTYEPLTQPDFRVVFTPADGGSPVEAVCRAVASTPGSYEGHVALSSAGRYVATAPEIPENEANRVTVEVVDIPLERGEPALQSGVLRSMAESAGGRYFELSDLPRLASALEGEKRVIPVQRSIPLDQSGVWFMLLAGLASVEWALRRKNQLV